MTEAPEGTVERPAGRIDPARSACVLIGVDAYTELDPLRGVRHNLTELRTVLTDESIWGIAADRLRVVANPQSAAELVRPVREMAERAEDTLIVYYSGHGLRDLDDDQLYLTLTGSEHRAPCMAVRFDDVLRAVQNHGSAKRHVVILDCCYSGMALGRRTAARPMSAADLPAPVAAIKNVRGSYLMNLAHGRSGRDAVRSRSAARGR